MTKSDSRGTRSSSSVSNTDIAGEEGPRKKQKKREERIKDETEKERINQTQRKTQIVTYSSPRHEHESNLWKELANRLGYPNRNSVKEGVEPFLRALFLLIPHEVENYLPAILEAEYTPASNNVSAPIERHFDLGHDWKLHVSSLTPMACEIFVTKADENEIEIPSLESIFKALDTMIAGTPMNIYLPSSVEDITGDAVTLQNFSLSFHSFQMPAISMDLVFEFDEESILSENIGLKEIRLSNVISVGSSIFLESTLSLIIGEIKVLAAVPTELNAPWIFVLDAKSSQRFSLKTLLSSVQLGDLTNTGIYSLLDSSGDPSISDLSFEIGTRGLTAITIGVESSFSADVGKVEFANPTVQLNVSSPFDIENRETALELSFDLQIGSKISAECGGEMTYTGGRNGTTSGLVTAYIEGDVKVKDLFDLSEAGDGLTLNIKELGLTLDVGEITASNPSFLFRYERKPSITFVWNDMFIQVGGTEKLNVGLSVPVSDKTGNLLSFIHLQYIKNDESSGGRALKSFATDIQVTGGIIEKGLKLLGPIGQHIIDQEQLTVTIEKSGRKKARFLMPDDFIPETITFGNNEQGLTLSNAKGFFIPKKPLEFGAGGDMELKILGLTTIFLGGELSVGPYGFSGSLAYAGDIQIGANIVLASLALVFEIKGTQPAAGANTKFRLYGEEGELGFTMGFTPPTPYPIPYPVSFRLDYPGELSIGGIVNAFLGDAVSIPDEVGNIIVISGTTDETTFIRGNLVLAFDVSEASFEVDCFVSALYGFFEGSVKGSFSATQGFELHAWLKPIDLGAIIQISGRDGNEAQMDIVIPGPLSNKKIRIYVDCAVTVLGIYADTFIEVNPPDGMIRFEVSGDMWGLLRASLIVAGDVSNDGGLLDIEATFENMVIEKITESSHDLVNQLVDGALSGLKAAKEDLQNKRRALNDLKAEREELLAMVRRQQEETVSQIRAAEAVVNGFIDDVKSLELKIDQNRAIVKREREAIADQMKAARRNLENSKRSLVRIDIEVEQRKVELLRKIQNMENEIKRLSASVRSADNTVKSWKKSVDWFKREIFAYEGRIRYKRRQIDALGFWTAWKAAAYLAEIAGYNATIAGLWTGQKGVEASMWSANEVLKGIEHTLYWARRRLNDLPVWTVDPMIVKLLADKLLTEVAIEAAKLVLSGVQEAAEWFPVDLDPRVAPFIVLKETATIALAGAREAVSLLGDVVENFNPNLDPRVLFHDGTVVVQKGLLDAAIVFLDGIHATVSGPMSSVLNFIADGVNFILESIPLVIKGVFFKSTLSTASSSGVNLIIDYSFIGKDHQLEFGFNFNALDPIEIIGEFCKEIANKILGLSGDGTRATSSYNGHQFSFEELMDAKNVLQKVEDELKVESEQIEVNFEFEKVSLKRNLFYSEESMVHLRRDLLTEHAFTGKEDKVILSNIEKIISPDKRSSGFQMLSNEDGTEFDAAISTIKSLLFDIESKAAEEEKKLENYAANLRAKKEEILKEEAEEEVQFAQLSASVLNDEEMNEKQNEVKRRVTERFKQHEHELRVVIEEDRKMERRIISERKGLYDQTLVQMSTLNSMSDHFIKEIEVLTRKSYSTPSSLSRSVQVDASTEPVELHECDAMMLRMTMYQKNLAFANESIQKRATYDKCLAQVCNMEDSILSILDIVKDDGVLGMNRAKKKTKEND